MRRARAARRARAPGSLPRDSCMGGLDTRPPGTGAAPARRARPAIMGAAAGARQSAPTARTRCAGGRSAQSTSRTRPHRAARYAGVDVLVREPDVELERERASSAATHGAGHGDDQSKASRCAPRNVPRCRREATGPGSAGSAAPSRSAGARPAGRGARLRLRAREGIAPDVGRGGPSAGAAVPGERPRRSGARSGSSWCRSPRRRRRTKRGPHCAADGARTTANVAASAASSARARIMDSDISLSLVRCNAARPSVDEARAGQEPARRPRCPPARSRRRSGRSTSSPRGRNIDSPVIIADGALHVGEPGRARSSRRSTWIGPSPRGRTARWPSAGATCASLQAAAAFLARDEAAGVVVRTAVAVVREDAVLVADAAVARAPAPRRGRHQVAWCSPSRPAPGPRGRRPSCSRRGPPGRRCCGSLAKLNPAKPSALLRFRDVAAGLRVHLRRCCRTGRSRRPPGRGRPRCRCRSGDG